MAHATGTETTSEFVIGLAAIRAELERLTGRAWSERNAQYLLETRVIPAGKLGGRVCTSRAAIRAVLERASTEPVAPRELMAASKSLTAGLKERAVDALICVACKRPFERPSGPGRPPRRCPDCRAGGAP